MCCTTKWFCFPNRHQIDPTEVIPQVLTWAGGEEWSVKFTGPFIQKDYNTDGVDTKWEHIFVKHVKSNWCIVWTLADLCILEVYVFSCIEHALPKNSITIHRISCDQVFMLFFVSLVLSLSEESVFLRDYWLMSNRTDRTVFSINQTDGVLHHECIYLQSKSTQWHHTCVTGSGVVSMIKFREEISGTRCLCLMKEPHDVSLLLPDVNGLLQLHLPLTHTTSVYIN